MVLGIVNWFGGLNQQTGRINNFGFLNAIAENADEGIYISRDDVPQQFQDLLESGVYVEFEIITDRRNRHRAVDLKLVSLVGIVDWYNNGRGYISCEGRNDVRVEKSSNLQAGDLVFFYLKYNPKTRKDNAILVQKVNGLTKDRIIIEKCAESNNPDISKRFIVKYATTLPIDEGVRFILDKIHSFSPSDLRIIADSLIDAENLLLASSELRNLLVPDEDRSSYGSKVMSIYCQLLKKHLSSSDESLQQELLDELFNKLRQANDLVRSRYWSQVNFLKENLEYKGNLWNIAPKEIKAKLIKEKYQTFFDILTQFNESKYRFSESLSFSWQKLYEFDNLDYDLVNKWCSSQETNTFKLAQMISARGAEKLVIKFYNALGYSVEDTSAHQVTGKSDIWRTGDVRLDSEVLLDVKNSRTSVNSKVYSEICVPSFKQNRGNDVLITGVLSPYLQYEFMNGRECPTFPVRDPIILGEFDKRTLIHLQDIFNDQFFLIDLSRNSDSKNYLPPWLFDYSDWFYIKQREIISNFCQLTDLDIPDWEDVLTVEVRPFPLFIAAKRAVPQRWLVNVPNWQRDFINFLINLPVKRISLPYLFIALLNHFLVMLSSQDNDYSPEQYQEFLYPIAGTFNPLNIYDPLDTVQDFCNTLQSLWNNRNSANLTSFKIFKFNGNGLLQGKRSKTDPQMTTILAYCGGWIDKKGKCGYQPLIIGQEQNCSICNRLICPKCQYCSNNCQEYRKRQKIYSLNTYISRSKVIEEES
jgi:cold shock CspA family protein